MSTKVSTPQLRAMYALAESRKQRHHRDCCCLAFKHIACNAADALWQNKLNLELDLLLERRDP